MKPDTLKIGAKTYRIDYIDVLSPDEDCGHCHHPRQLIRIDSSLPESEQEETLLHEILHTCCTFVGIEGKCTEEEFITRVSPILYTVLKENNHPFFLLNKP